MPNLFRKGINLRVRLFRKLFYRIWKSFAILRVKKYIESVLDEGGRVADASGPAVILCNLKHVRDLYVLMYLFREKEFCFVGLRSMEKIEAFKQLASLNRVIFLDPRKKAYSFLREILVNLRNFNRAVVFFPKIGLDVSSGLVIDPTTLVRIAMMGSVPIVPVSIAWANTQALKCKVVLGKRCFVSPASAEFRDVFFERRGVRKYSRLDRNELKVVAERIYSKLESDDGSNIS